MTSSIRLSDVLVTVKNFAFHASCYPLIISLENHCTRDQQKRMVKLFRGTLGGMESSICICFCAVSINACVSKLTADMLPARFSSYKLKTLPSPDTLKYKILIKVLRHIFDMINLY